MDFIASLIQGALDASAIAVEDVTEVNVDGSHCCWNVQLLPMDTLACFGTNWPHPFVPYAVVSKQEADDWATI